MSKHTKYYAETAYGCTIIEARNAQQALKIVLSDVGERGRPVNVRKATKEDISWVAGMGGPA